MQRRSFLAALAGAFALDPERALYVPGKKLISIPRPRSAFLSIGDIVEIKGLPFRLRVASIGTGPSLIVPQSGREERLLSLGYLPIRFTPVLA